MKTYTAAEIEEKINSISGWHLMNDAIEKPFKFKDFKQALTFINAVGEIAEQADHHPEILNVYNRVTLRLNTHSANGITDKDFDLAKKINGLN
jgi:4a-hydroxytetrahydrobiopterin dehydratase